MNLKKEILTLLAVLSGILTANAQLSSNPDKFLGNITTSYNVDYGNEKFRTLWNQITCENESKWASIEGTNNSFNWSGSDRAYNYARSYNYYIIDRQSPDNDTKMAELLMNFDLLNSLGNENSLESFVVAEHHRPQHSEWLPSLISAIKNTHPVTFTYID